MKNLFAAFKARLNGGVLIAFFAGSALGLAFVGEHRGLINAADAIKLSGAAIFALGALFISLF